MTEHTRMNEFLTHSLLNFKRSGSMPDDMIEDLLNDDGTPAYKNVCAKITIPLAGNLETACTILHCSKRVFIESAIIDALRQFDDLANEYDVYQPHEVKGESL
ncbi:hypothetical protein JHD50_09260 [Sulfurimonas sp. MAG313]|nr:hypothetical protein [Sulfurimonas sp. MAG313]MDF1881486.1 hypothetical protein [Sulfurimonas sp. MAG313]